MTSMDIIEALGGIDPALILDAKQPTAGRIPKWLKWTSVAACVCYLTAAAVLSVYHILTPSAETGQVLASTEESIPDVSSQEETSNTVNLNSEKYGLSLNVPAEYAGKIQIDTPLTSEEYLDAYQDNIAFTLYDGTSDTFDEGGFVWAIAVEPIEECDFNYFEYFELTTCVLNRAQLGTDENYVYVLIYPDVRLQFDNNNYNAAARYSSCAEAGYEMLLNFCQENGFTSDGTWTTRYQEKILDPLDELLAQFPGSTEKVVLTSEKYGLSISVPDAYVNEITVDTPFDFTVSVTGAYIYSFENVAFCFQDTSQTNDFYIPETDPGYVFMISVYDTSEYVKGDYYDLHLTFTNAVLGTKGDLTYIVTYPIPEFQCDETYENVSSYYDHIWAAYEILEDFVKRNDLNDDGDWKKRYTEHMITTSDDFENTLGISVNVSSNSGAILKCPAEYEYLFTVDQTHTDGKYTDVSYENMIFGYYNRPSKNEVPELIWGIVTFPKGEYPYKNFEEETYAYNHVLLGSDERFDYALLYQADHEFAFASSEDAETFFHRASDGMEVIRDFIRINKLSDGSSWELTFSSRVLKPVWDNLKYMKEFEK